MQIPQNIIVIIHGLSAVLSLYLLVYLQIRGRRTSLLFCFSSFLILVFLSSAYPLVLYWCLKTRHYTFSVLQICVWIQYMSSCFMGLNWLLFSLYYVNRNRGAKKWLALLFIVPLFFYLAMLTNRYHHLFFSTASGIIMYWVPTIYISPSMLYQHRIFFWLHFATSTLYFLIGMVILIKYLIGKFGYAKRRTILLISAAVIPFLFNMMQEISLDFVHKDFISVSDIRFWLDLAPFGHLLALLIFVVVTFKYRFLNIIPLAHRKLIDNMNVLVLLVDGDNHILDFNQGFAEEFVDSRITKRKLTVEFLIEHLRLKSNHLLDDRVVQALTDPSLVHFTGEIGIASPNPKFFTVTIQPILWSRQEVVGRIISFNDVTDYRNCVEELNDKNEELMMLNEELKRYAETVEELAIVEERNRVARDVHDTLGHTMTLLITLLEVGRVNIKENPVAAEKINKALHIARDGLTEIRRSISGLVPAKLETASLGQAINNVIDDFRSSGLNVEFSVDGKDFVCNKEQADTIYRVCQEAMTNSVRHGKAQNVNILLRLESDRIKLFIFDDGCGCSSIVKGMGLFGMEQRINNLKGTFIYGSDGEHGFNIRIELPLNVS